MAIGDFNHIKDVLTTLDGLRPSRFGYTEAAVNATGANELAALVGFYVTEDSTQINSIPAPDLIGVDPLIINIGLRSQAASATRHTMNHFFGRLGLNLLKLTEKTKLLVENHLVNRYITPSGYVLEDIALGYTETTVTVTQSKSPLAANEPTTAATVLSMTGAVYNGNAGVMTGADKKKLDDAAASLNIAGLTTGKLLRYNSATGKIESATVAESGGALSGVTTLGMSGQLTNTVTGVAPFVVSSAIQVANLNASLLQGYSISTSGACIPLLNGTNTWSGAQTITGTSPWIALSPTGWASPTYIQAGINYTNNNVGDYLTISVPADKHLRLQTRGTGIVTIDGNVGIGTTSPNYELDVNGQIHTNSTINQTVNGLAQINKYGAGDWEIVHRSTGDILFYTDSANKMPLILKQGGNVGIGTVNPNVKLEVSSAIRISNVSGGAFLEFAGGDGLASGSRNYEIRAYNGINGLNILKYPDDWSGAGTSLITLLANGNVGIGTINPNYELDVNGQIHTNSTINQTVNGLAQINKYGAGDWEIVHRSTGDILFYTDSTNKMPLILKQGGNVGIGTTNPESDKQLHVVSSLTYGIYSSSSNGVGIRGISESNYGVHGTSSSNIGVFGSSSSSHGVYGRSFVSGAAGVYGHTVTTGALSVGGNTAYNTAFSSQFMKYGEEYSIIDAIHKNPFTIKRYTWEDSNYEGFFEFIGPYKEDIYQTFKLTHNIDGLFSVDGIALGLGIELLSEVDLLKLKVQKLEEQIILLGGTI